MKTFYGLSIVLALLSATGATAQQYQPVAAQHDQVIRVAKAEILTLRPQNALEFEQSAPARPTESSPSDAPAPRVSHIDAILKPVRDIDVVLSSRSEDKSPENKAAEHATDAEVYMLSEFHPRSTPLRYPVCSLHNPLYFEEPNLERCGNACGCATTAISALHFMSGAVLLPYRMATESPCMTRCASKDCVCGQSMPCQRPLECKLRGMISEGAAAAGFVFLML